MLRSTKREIWDAPKSQPLSPINALLCLDLGAAKGRSCDTNQRTATFFSSPFGSKILPCPYCLSLTCKTAESISC